MESERFMLMGIYLIDTREFNVEYFDSIHDAMEKFNEWKDCRNYIKVTLSVIIREC